MRSYIHLEVSLMIETFLFLKVNSASQSAFEQVPVSSRVFHEASRNIDFAVPCVLDDSIDHLGLHGLVHAQASHQVERAVIIKIFLLQQESDFMRVVNAIQEFDYALVQVGLELLDAHLGKRVVILDETTDVEDLDRDQEWIDVAHKDTCG